MSEIGWPTPPPGDLVIYCSCALYICTYIWHTSHLNAEGGESVLGLGGRVSAGGGGGGAGAAPRHSHPAQSVTGLAGKKKSRSNY